MATYSRHYQTPFDENTKRCFLIENATGQTVADLTLESCQNEFYYSDKSRLPTYSYENCFYRCLDEILKTFRNSGVKCWESLDELADRQQGGAVLRIDLLLADGLNGFPGFLKNKCTVQIDSFFIPPGKNKISVYLQIPSQQCDDFVQLLAKQDEFFHFQILKPISKRKNQIFSFGFLE